MIQYLFRGSYYITEAYIGGFRAFVGWSCRSRVFGASWKAWIKTNVMRSPSQQEELHVSEVSRLKQEALGFTV